MKRVYSFPRHFDLVTIFVAVALWSGILALLKILALPWQTITNVSLMLLFVALMQIIFQPLGYPRMVSACAGAVYPVAYALVVWGYVPTVVVVYWMFWGAFLGYVAGICIAAAPLLSDLLRPGNRQSSERDQPAALDKKVTNEKSMGMKQEPSNESR